MISLENHYRPEKRKTLSYLLRFWTIIFICAPVMVTGIFYIINEAYETEDRYRENLLLMVTGQHRLLDQWFSERAADIRVVSKSFPVKSRDISSIGVYVNQLLIDKPQFFNIIYVNKEGVVEYNRFGEGGYSIADRAFFQESLQGKDAISSLLFARGPAQGTPLVTFSSPVYDSHQNVQGVVFGSVKMDTLQVLVEPFRLGKTGETYLIDTEGNMLTQSRFTQEPYLRVETMATRNAADHSENVDEYNDYRGERVLGAYVLLADRNIIVVSEIDKREVMAPFYRQVVAMLVILPFFLAGAVWFVRIWSRGMEEPMMKLVEGAQKIREGLYGFQIEREFLQGAPLELHKLCETFNEMSTAAKESYHEIQEAEEKYRVVVESSLTGICFHNGQFMYVNPAFCDIFGYSQEEFLVMGPLEITDLEDRGIVLEAMKKQLIGETQLIHAQQRGITKDGRTKYLDVCSTTTIYQGRVAIVACVVDITQQVETAAELARIEAQTIASTQKKSQILLAIDNEIRFPLETITGMVDLMEETHLTDEQRKYISRMKLAGNRLRVVANNVLSMSLLGMNGATTRELAQVCLKSLIQRIFTALAPIIQEKGIFLEFHEEDAIPSSIICDAHGLERILDNLIRHAVACTEEGGVSLVITISSDIEVALDQVALLFIIKDTSAGLNKVQLDSIFEPCVQPRMLFSRQSGGTGLDMTVAKLLVEGMGGYIRASSIMKQGSQIAFTITVAQGMEGSKDVLTAKKGGHDRGENDKPIVILLVDDSEDSIMVFQRLLRNDYCRIEYARDGVEAVEKFTAKQYDLVFIDMEIPIMDGYSVTKAIRNWEQESGMARTPVIAFTSYSLQEYISRILTAGCDDYIIKPVVKTKLLGMVKKYS